MKICIIGGGLTGLTAAYQLGESHEVDMYEKRDRLGGCISSYDLETYHIEHYYHHCFAGDRHLFALLQSLGIAGQLEWLRGTTGYCAGGTIYPLNSPLEILRYPLLTLPDKVRLAFLTLRSRRMPAGPLDQVTARDFVVREVGERAYSSFFEPLLISKFGDQMDRVSAAWLVSRIAIRSNRGLSGERLGYLRGGFQDLVHALADAIGRHCTVRLNDPVTSLARDPHGWRVNGQLYDRVLSTIPPQSLVEAGGPAFAPVPYQGAACMLLAMDREVTDGLYWLNMKDRAPYGAVITHTNFAPLERYGEHLVYLASYFLGKMPERLDQLMLRDFCTRFEVREGEIHWRRMAVEPWAGPVFVTGYRDLIPAYQEKGLYMAGMFSFPNYPERSMEGAVVAGQEAAALIDRGGQA